MTDQPFEITWTAASRRALARLPEKIGAAVIEFCYGPLADSPHRVGKALRFELAGFHCARRGDFRVIYRIEERRRRVAIVGTEHRADVYRRRNR